MNHQALKKRINWFALTVLERPVVEGLSTLYLDADLTPSNWRVWSPLSVATKYVDGWCLAQPTFEERVGQVAMPLMDTDERVVDECVACIEHFIDRSKSCH